MIDNDRIKRVAMALSEKGIDIAVVFQPAAINYLVGSKIDYATAFMTKDGEPGVICWYLEADRSKRDSWAKIVQPYLTYQIEDASDDAFIVKDHIEAVATSLRKLGFKEATVGLEGLFLSFSDYHRLKSLLPSAKLIDCSDLLNDLRMIKTALEMRKTRKAACIVDEGIESAINSIKVGVTELGVAAKADYAMGLKGSLGEVGAPIVASGKRSALPHGRATSKKIAKDDFVTVDLVSNFEGYHADETRTVVVGKPSEKQKKIYNVVLEAQRAAIDAVRPGVACSLVDRAARDVIGRAGYGRYFTHTTGHGLGLEVHEKPRFGANDRTILTVDMIMTVEPGIYIPGFGGVRIEDDVRVTPRGREILTGCEK